MRAPENPPLVPLRQSFVALFIGVLLTLIPILSHGEALLTGYLGSPTPDLFDHVFLFELGFQRLQSGNGFPTFSQLIRGPVGGALVMPDKVGIVIYSIIRQFSDRPLAFNIALGSGLFGGALGAGLLARRLGANAGGILLSSALFGGSAYAYAQIYNGETETLRLGTLPFTLYLLLEARRCILRGNKAYISSTLAGFALGFSFFACWYYGAYLLLITGAAITLDLLPRLYRQGRPKKALPLIAGILSSATLLIPEALALSKGLADTHSLFRMPSVLTILKTDPLALAASSTDLANVVSQGALSSHQGYLHGGFIGAVALALLVASVIARPKASRGLLILGGVFFILALGPILHIQGETATLFGQAVELPYVAASKVIPYFASMRLPYRAMSVVQLCIAVLGGMALGFLIPWTRGWWSLLPGAILTLAIMGDVNQFSGLNLQPQLVNIPAHPGAEILKNRRGGVLDLPMGFLQDDRRGLYLAQQPDHLKWIPYSLMSTQLAPELATNAFIIALGAHDPGFTHQPLKARQGTDLDTLLAGIDGAFLSPSLMPASSDVNAGIAALRQSGIETIALHTSGLGADYDPYRAILSEHFGDPFFHVKGMELYTLNASNQRKQP